MRSAVNSAHFSTTQGTDVPGSIYEQAGNKKMLDVTSVEELARKDGAEQVRGNLEGSDPGE